MRCKLTYRHIKLCTVLNRCFITIRLALNRNKTNFPNSLANSKLVTNMQISYTDQYVKLKKKKKCLGVQIDIHLNWKSHVELILQKLIATYIPARCCVLCISPQFWYMLITFWVNSYDSNKILLLQKKVIRITAILRKDNHVEDWI